MSLYADEYHAFAQSFSGGEGSPKPAGWQSACQSRYRDSKSRRTERLETMTTNDRAFMGACAQKLEREALAGRTFLILYAKHSRHDTAKLAAIKDSIIRKIADTLKTPAPSEFRRMCIWAWVSEKYSRDNAAAIIAGAKASKSSAYRWRKEIERSLDEVVSQAATELRPVMQERGWIQE